jgi:hypothetical protein
MVLLCPVPLMSYIKGGTILTFIEDPLGHGAPKPNMCMATWDHTHVYLAKRMGVLTLNPKMMASLAKETCPSVGTAGWGVFDRVNDAGGVVAAGGASVGGAGLCTFTHALFSSSGAAITTPFS